MAKRNAADDEERKVKLDKEHAKQMCIQSGCNMVETEESLESENNEDAAFKFDWMIPAFERFVEFKDEVLNRN